MTDKIKCNYEFAIALFLHHVLCPSLAYFLDEPIDSSALLWITKPCMIPININMNRLYDLTRE